MKKPNYPLKQLKQDARKAVANEVAKKRLPKPTRCSRCGKESDWIHAHHVDYSDFLNVVWLCAPCHRAVHAELRAARGPVIQPEKMLKMLKKMQGKKTFREFAGEIGVAPGYLHEVLHGVKPPGEKILDLMGLRRETEVLTVYVEKPASKK